MKTKTVTVGLLTLIMATLFGVQIWNGLTAIYPQLSESAWANWSIVPIFGKVKYFLQSIFQAFLTFIAIQITKIGVTGD